MGFVVFCVMSSWLTAIYLSSVCQSCKRIKDGRKETGILLNSIGPWIYNYFMEGKVPPEIGKTVYFIEQCKVVYETVSFLCHKKHLFWHEWIALPVRGLQRNCYFCICLFYFMLIYFYFSCHFFKFLFKPHNGFRRGIGLAMPKAQTKKISFVNWSQINQCIISKIFWWHEYQLYYVQMGLIALNNSNYI